MLAFAEVLSLALRVNVAILSQSNFSSHSTNVDVIILQEDLCVAYFPSMMMSAPGLFPPHFTLAGMFQSLVMTLL